MPRIDREMRSLDQREDREGPRHGVGIGLYGPAGGAERHYPDLRFKTASGHGVAVELELTAKSARRLYPPTLGPARNEMLGLIGLTA